MKTTELRFGNLIYEVWNGKKDVTIFDFTLYESHNVNGKTHFDPILKCEIFDKIEPIPLTEERLLSFGLIDRKIKLNTIDRTLNLSAIVDGKYYFYLEDIDGNTFCLNYIQYVHELQNLYFILTGTELEIK